MNSFLKRLLRETPIVVTGMGCFSAAGESSGELAANVFAGNASARFCPQLGKVVCRAPAIDVSRQELRFVRKMDRSVQMAWIAAHQAWDQARLHNALPAERIGIAVGTSRGPLQKSAESFAGAGDPRFLPSLGADSTFAAASGALACGFGAKGPGATISATCASAALAITFAAEQILLGKADVVIAGGTEAPLHPATLSQLEAAGVLGFNADPTLTCRPFDRSRNGMILGEGSAFVVLESARSAAARGVGPLARLAGWASGFELSGRTGVDEAGAGLTQVMQNALDLAGLAPGDIDYINAHGTGTVMNDQAEALAVRGVFGERTAELPCSSTKPVTGHCLGATPALEAVISVEALRQKRVPPTAGCLELDPQCPINPIAQRGSATPVRAVMSNSLGFWGYHASLIFSEV